MHRVRTRNVRGHRTLYTTHAHSVVVWFRKLHQRPTCNNSKKSSVLICKNRATLHVPSPSFAVNDIAIGEVAKVKYLGHVITNDMTDDADMMRQRRQ